MDKLLSELKAIDAEIDEPNTEHAISATFKLASLRKRIIAHLEQAERERWISRHERMPEYGASVVTLDENGKQAVAVYSKFGWLMGTPDFVPITHWRVSLPPAHTKEN